MPQARSLTNSQLVTLAVYRLGGAATPVDTEDIAVEASALAPGRFAWKKYPDRIDLILVRVSLNDACRAEPPLLTGSIRRGYMLTTNGLEWAPSRDAQLGATAPPPPRRHAVEADMERERERLRRSRAYGKYVSGRSQEITELDFQEFARVNDYFQEPQRQKRYTRISNAVEGDDTLKRVWDTLQEKFVGGKQQ